MPGRPIDAAALAHQQRRLARAAQPPWLHGEVASRMAERLEAIRVQPARVLDWAAFNGHSADLLQARYPKSRLVQVEPEPLRRVAPKAPWWAALRGRAAVALAPDEVPPASADLLWSNMGLHAVADPQAQFAAWHRVIAVDGFLMFSTFGPGTLAPLAALYREAGWPPPLAPLVDMHDLGDMLVQAGFADPVMDQQTLTLTWPDAGALLAELRSLGGNAEPRRFAGLRTPRWRAQLAARLQALAGADGRLALPFEIVHGHAFRAATRVRMAEETQVALDDMRAMVRARPPRS